MESNSLLILMVCLIQIGVFTIDESFISAAEHFQTPAGVGPVCQDFGLVGNT